jgi:4-hydroxy-tetrahydrodipicolinate synthase
MENTFFGSGVALVTPFDKNGDVDYSALKKLVRFQIENGTDFLVVQGTTGESPTLSNLEKLKVLDTVFEENKGRLPIVYGVGGNDTKKVAEQISVVPNGVDGILSVSPYYNKPTQAGIIGHYEYIASHTELPIILYNVPGRTGSNILPETTLRLSEVGNIVAIKEASGNMEQIMEIIRIRPAGFGVLSGDDALTMPLIAAGADGVISVVANALPELFSKMVHASMVGDLNEARALHYKLLPITKMFFEQGNPGGVKAALATVGIMENELRMPLVPVSLDLNERISDEMSQLEKIARFDF